MNPPCLVCEYLCAFEGDNLSATDSASTAEIRREGMAMLQALTEDLAASQIQVAGLVHTGWKESWAGHPGVRWIWTEDDDHSRSLIHSAISGGWKVVIVAPEIEGTLAAIIQLCEFLGARVHNSTSAAIQLTSDKLQLAEHLEKHRIPTIPTRLVQHAEELGTHSRYVVKPIDGAGSLDVFVVNDWREAPETETCQIVQPYLRGRSASVAVIMPALVDGEDCDSSGYSSMAPIVWPVASQRIVESPEQGHLPASLKYQGGALPADKFTAEERAILEALALKACASIEGLCGYTGVDMVWPEESAEPLVVEINPRLCTSYLGYRQIFGPQAALVVAGYGEASTKTETFADKASWKTSRAEW